MVNPARQLPPGAERAPPATLPSSAYHSIVEQVQAAMFVVQDNRFLFVNPRLTDLFGYSRPEMMEGMDPIEMCAPHDRDRVREQVRQRISGVQGHTYEIECIRKDGSLFAAQVCGVRIELFGKPADLVTLHDISAIKRAKLVAEQRAQLMVNAEELARIGSAETDLTSGLMTLSAGMCTIFGEPFSDTPVAPSWFFDRVAPHDKPYVQAISESVAPGEPFEFQHRILHASGEQRTVLHRGLAEADSQGRVVRAVTLLQDITEQRAAEQRLDRLTNSDEVTGLPNRNAAMDKLDEMVRQAEREEGAVTVMAIRIDQLKLVSESLGYAGGDRLLMAVSLRLQEALESRHLLAHLGAGEYLVLVPEAALAAASDAVVLAQSLIDRLARPFAIEETEVKVTCGIGLALFPADGAVPEKLLNHAQAAMYRAHDLGENQICRYNAEMPDRAAMRLSIEAALRRALDREEFSLHYQPKVDLRTGALVGAEALLRWAQPNSSLPVSRAEFVRVAEETGLIIPIGDWVLHNACAQAMAWQRLAPTPLRVAVNLSARQLQQPDIVRRVQAALRASGLPPQGLGLEIKESALVGARSQVAGALAELKALGVEISLDDFGTGYSNLSHLRSLPIDVIKVDRSFVHDVTAATQDVSITRAIITMAHSLQMRVLAEGVETQGQLALLIANHCDEMQGNYFSAAVPPAELEALVKSGRGLPEHLLQRNTRKRTLLLVDDEESIVSSLKRLLRRDGYHIVTATSGEQGLQRLAENAVDVILSDQRMPGMTGVEFLRRAKELYPETVRMVLSGYTELQSITDAINEGAIYKFLTKPWDDERLRGHIAEAFSSREMVDENQRLGSAVVVANHELSEVNDRLQKLLASQNERITREESSLTVAREALNNMPVAVVGLDEDGLVAFVNLDAQALLQDHGPLLGQHASQALAPDLVEVWRLADARHHPVRVGDKPYRAACRAASGAANPRGTLLVIMPATEETGV
jgi:diguanylate cyclase (GGDEF)-like protein/PAS domain S-box-containing protein